MRKKKLAGIIRTVRISGYAHGAIVAGCGALAPKTLRGGTVFFGLGF